MASASSRRAMGLTRPEPIGSQPPMHRLHIASILLAVLTTIACSDDPAPADTSSPDTSVADTSSPDTTASDTTPADTLAPADTSETPDTADTLAPADTTDTTDTADTAACEYFENPLILQCGEGQVLTQALAWEDFTDPAACAPYYTRGANRYDTIEALAQGEGCDAGCIYVASQAVDFIRCDQQGRSGWETFTATGEGCLEAVYRTEDGLFTDLCLWATYACYCTGDPG